MRRMEEHSTRANHQLLAKCASVCFLEIDSYLDAKPYWRIYSRGSFDVIDEAKQECGKMPIALVTDNASNIKKILETVGGKYSELTCYGCAAHSMNLIFGDLMKSETLKKVKHQAK